MKSRVFSDTLKKDKNLFILFGIMTGVNLSVVLLYRVFTEAFLYAEAIVFVFMLLLFLIDFIRNTKHFAALENSERSIKSGNNELPPARTLDELKYREMTEGLINKINEMTLSFDKEKRDMEDWYTVWVHQIKTPIAVLKLKAEGSDRELQGELFRIEEYTDMALSYIRLGSEQNDLVIKEYRLDELIRETLRKYAYQFIAKKIRLEYTPADATVITDKKWLQCIFEQYISNAVKYSKEGTVSVTFSDGTLTVADTGVGISPEDIPRIFEKGYTGSNGRLDAKSSGLGLYLSKKAADLIGVTLSLESELGAGSSFSISFPENKGYHS